MLRQELTEVQFIAPIDNLASIYALGILSHNRMRNLQHVSVALQEVQDLRATKIIPGGMNLHDYANLYICARNPMMYKRRAQHASLCVLSISTDVLDIPGAVVTDQNAASKYVRYLAAPDGLAHVDKDRTFARDWRHPDDQIEEWRHRSRKCAEVLIPHEVRPDHIAAVYVSGVAGEARVRAIDPSKTVRVNGDLFFQ